MNLLVKEQLSKLLATENINVEHSNVRTAQFNLETRTLTLPNWSESVSNDIYDLLTSHEVGHALYTPYKEAKTILMDNNYPNIKFFINVVEDSRIERMIKDTYPGLKKNYHNGYRELYDRDFFELKDRDIDSLPLIDRLNLNEKIGNFTIINFKPEEKFYVDEIKKTKTFKDVVELSKKLYQYSKEEQYLNELENELEQYQENLFYDSDIEISVEDEEDLEDGFIKDSPKNNSTKKLIEKIKEKIEDFKEEVEAGNHVGNREYDKFEPKAETQEKLEKNVENISTTNDNKIYVQFPDIQYEKYITEYKNVIEIIKKNKSFLAYVDKKDYIQAKREVKNSIEYMIKIFESKKAAAFYVRNKTAKTGTIDSSKLFSYKYNEDIFKKINIVPEGKNHGMIILFDWSGSMCQPEKLYAAFKQLISTVLFCRKMNIPFRVFLFGCELIDNFDYVHLRYDKYHKQYSHKYKNFELYTEPQNFSLVEILNSNMNKNEFNYVMEYFTSLSKVRFTSNFYFGGTPLTEACHTVDYIIKDFKNDNNIEICNLLVITDGINNEMGRYYNNHVGYLSGQKIMVRDKETKKIQEAVTTDVGMLSTKLHAIKDKHKCNTIGFFVGEKYDINQILYKYAKRSNVNDLNKQLRKNYCATIIDCGYDEYHIINNNYLEEESTLADAKTVRSLKTSFNKFLKKKNLNKIVLSKFVETISKQVI